MADLLLRIGISNLCVSLGLAVVAWVVQTSCKRPRIAHLVWVLALVKLVTPPVVTVPVVAVPGLAAVTAPARRTAAPGLDASTLAVPGPEARGATATPETAGTSLSPATSSIWIEHGKSGLALLWLVGSVVVLCWSLVRVYRFHRLLARASKEGPPELQSAASKIARRLGLSRTPTIHTTSAHLSPLVWWIGGRVRVMIPADLLREMGDGRIRWILAHELAHVRRRDHLVRWLEWLACVCFWWNPVAWWARRNLRANEEVCCDALVLESLKPDPRTYGNSLLAVFEFLASPTLRPPAMASEVVSGGSLERRFAMIVSANPVPRTPRWLNAVILLAAVVLLPLGVAYAAPDYEAVGKRLRRAVAAGELTDVQARAMMAVLRMVEDKESAKDVDRRHDADELGRRTREAVAAGKMTPEQGRARMQAYKKSKAAAGREEGERRFTPEDLERAGREIRMAIAEGKMTAEEGRAEMDAMRKMMAGEDGGRTSQPTREEMGEVRKRIRAAVEAGKITEEQAEVRREAYMMSIGERRAEGRCR